MSKLIIYLCTIFLTIITTATYVTGQVSGKVMDNSGSPLIGASVIEANTSNGTITDIDGSFRLVTSSANPQLEISYTGFVTQIVEASGVDLLITLAEGSLLDEVVVTGSRGKDRTILTSPVPIDNINAADLKASGQKTVNDMINYKIPSFNSTPQTISDASAHFNPSELRNLGPSRTLVLINGKRKNQSAQVFLNRTPGRGEVGTDFKSLPSSAVERIEVLRDGASAQYGSDAVAGVVNIILKERVDETEINLQTGVTYEGDGFNYSADVNHGFKIGEKGFLNLTGDFFHTDYTNRAGEPGGDGLFGELYAIGAIPLGAAGPQEATPGVLATAEQILSGDTDWQRENPDLGMIVGIPEQNRVGGFANFGLDHGAGEFYANAGYTFRYGRSFALYRVPWWPGVGSARDSNPLYTDRSDQFQGFQPTFESDVEDITFNVGNRFDLSGWDLDVSFTHGSNDVQYLVSNSVNVGLGLDSPTSVDPGGYNFSNSLGNLDLSRNFGDVSFYAGAEIRRESFDVRAGEPASFETGGIQSFPGLQPGNELGDDEGSRTNVGIYAGADYDISPELLVGGALRYETFSSIGDGDSQSNLSWKVNARQLIGDNKGAIRASISTGFRAPSLHQIYLSNIQTLVVDGTIAQQGTFNNVDDITRVSLGVPQLDVETSTNITAGITYRLSDNISATLDYYNVSVDDRVLLSTQVSTGALPEGNAVRELLTADGVEAFAFFTNAADTKTQGIDVVVNFENLISIGDNHFGATAAFNWNDTDVDTDNLTVPAVFSDNNIDIFGREEIGRLQSARPNLKGTIGLNGKFGNLRTILNNTYFGEVTETHPSNASLDQDFSGKVVTDLILGYGISDKLDVNLIVNNLFNVYPDELEGGDQDNNIDLGGRFRYPWHVNQFGFMGGIVKLGVTIKL